MDELALLDVGRAGGGQENMASRSGKHLELGGVWLVEHAGVPLGKHTLLRCG